jgi:hypothetical protein
MSYDIIKQVKKDIPKLSEIVLAIGCEAKALEYLGEGWFGQVFGFGNTAVKRELHFVDPETRERPHSIEVITDYIKKSRTGISRGIPFAPYLGYDIQEFENGDFMSYSYMPRLHGTTLKDPNGLEALSKLKRQAFKDYHENFLSLHEIRFYTDDITQANNYMINEDGISFYDLYVGPSRSTTYTPDQEHVLNCYAAGALLDWWHARLQGGSANNQKLKKEMFKEVAGNMHDALGSIENSYYARARLKEMRNTDFKKQLSLMNGLLEKDNKSEKTCQLTINV